MSWFVHLVSLLNSWTFQRSLFSALFLVAFYGLFRIGELTAESNRFAHQFKVELQRCLAYCGLDTSRYKLKVTVFVLVALVMRPIGVTQMRKS